MWLGLLILSIPRSHGALADPITTTHAPIKAQYISTPDYKPIPLLAVAELPLAGLGTYDNTYAWGNCTWYVAGRINVPPNLGNANTWAMVASQDGFGVSSTPIIGAVAQTTAGYLGHVAIVEAINGGLVTVSEMNAQGLGVVDQRTTPISDWIYIYI